MKSQKKVLTLFGLALFFGMFFVISVPSAGAVLGENPSIFHSDESPGTSSVTISSANTIDNPVKLSGYLGSYYIGYAHKSSDGVWQFHIDGYGSAEGIYNTVKNGEILRIYHSQGKEQGAFDVSVKTTIKENKEEKAAEIQAPRKNVESVTEKEINALKKKAGKEGNENKDKVSTKDKKESEKTTEADNREKSEKNEIKTSDKPSDNKTLNKEESRKQDKTSLQSTNQESKEESSEKIVQEGMKNEGYTIYLIISLIFLTLIGVAIIIFRKINKKVK
ncbi:hypothetical protein [Bacillus halotolerans]|uniref:hypothetical protein n=1 Tax=Bacillus halotolerans TaxID=260554 RepID=UPI004049A371